MKERLTFFDQGSCSVYGQVAYHDFEGIAEEADEAPKIFSALGDKFTMIMGNHGLLTIGRTIAEAIANMGRLVRAYETQERLLAANATPAQLSRGICEFTVSQINGKYGNAPGGFRLECSFSPFSAARPIIYELNRCDSWVGEDLYNYIEVAWFRAPETFNSKAPNFN